MSILTYSDIHVHVYVIYISPVFNEAAGWPINQSSDQSLFFFSILYFRNKMFLTFKLKNPDIILYSKQLSF